MITGGTSCSKSPLPIRENSSSADGDVAHPCDVNSSRTTGPGPVIMGVWIGSEDGDEVVGVVEVRWRKQEKMPRGIVVVKL